MIDRIENISKKSNNVKTSKNYLSLSFISNEWKRWSDLSSDIIYSIFRILKDKQADSIIQAIISSNESIQHEEESKVEKHIYVSDVVYEDEYIVVNIPYQSLTRVKSYERKI